MIDTGEVGECSFRTRSGVCIITEKQIILKRKGVLARRADFLYDDSMVRVLVLYAILGVSALAAGVLLLVLGSWAAGTFVCVFGLFLLWNVYFSRNNSANPEIERSSIRSVEAHPPRRLITRGYFTVRFLERGRERKRLIMMPGSISGGTAEYQRALSMMQVAGLLGEA